jgi:hypothetical protein
MRIHKARNGAYNLDREREYNWWKGRPSGPVHRLSAAELAEFAKARGLQAVGAGRDVRHK